MIQFTSWKIYKYLNIVFHLQNHHCWDSMISKNHTKTVFTFPFYLQQPESIIISLHFRATGATEIDITSIGMKSVNIYKRDTTNGRHMGGTSRYTPESCTANLSLNTGKHLLRVTVQNGINRPAIFWGQGCIAGGASGNIYV